jgi:3-methyladenine DNA glycosylase AlkD
MPVKIQARTTPMTVAAICRRLSSQVNPEAIQGMARYGITAKQVYGWSAPALKALAREMGRDHARALRLWKTGSLEARALAGLTGRAEELTAADMDAWAADFDSWAICDGTCMNLFRHSPLAWQKCLEWSGREDEFVKRAGFALIASLTVSAKQASDADFLRFLPIIERESVDARNMVKKAINWALRQIGKRNPRLHRAAISSARRIRAVGAPSARWIAADALRELEGEAVRKRMEILAQRASTSRRAARA